MPGPYNPPQPRRTQVVPTRRGASTPRWRWWRLVPMLGLVPVLVAVLATQGAFNRPASRQQAAPVAAAPTTVAAGPTTVSVADATVLPTPAATAVAPSASNGTAPATTATSGTAGSSVSSTSGTTGTGNASAAGGATSVTTGTTSSGAAAAETPATATNSTAYVAYRVQPGDTVRFVARTYGVSAVSIVQASGLSNPDLLHVGQVLTVPAQPGWVYRVQPGETLDQIAARTGVAGERIASASGLSIASVGPGSVLLIPDQSVAAHGK